MGGRFTSDNLQAQHEFGFDWARHALACDMGEFQVVTPIERGRVKGGFVLRNGKLFLVVTEKETDLLDDSGEHFLFSLTRATPERVSVISYSTYDAIKGARVENFDLGADGVLDYRKTEIKGHTSKEEYRVGDAWLELQQRESGRGVVFAGRFMPVSDAIKLANSRTPK